MTFRHLYKNYGKKFFTILFFCFVAILYFHNVTRDIYSGDIGDLVTASYLLGVPHPPGYPLFTMLGYVFSHLPLLLPVVTKVTFINIIASLAALILYFRFCFSLTKSYFLSLLSTSMLAFSYLFWLHAEIPEVFGLNNLFVTLIIILALSFFKKPRIKTLSILAFTCGLSLTHQQTILFLFPPLAIVLLGYLDFFRKMGKSIFYPILFFFLGFIPYVYVPLAAAHNPAINWDNASTIQNFLHLILRKDYGAFSPSLINQVPIDVKLIHVHTYITTLITNFSFQLLFLGLLGAWYVGMKEKKLGIFLLSAFIFSGPFFAFYAATLVTTTTAFGVIERFYNMSFIVFMFLIPYGLHVIKNFLDKRVSVKLYSLLLLSYFLIIPFYMLQVNFQKTDLSKTQIGTTFASNILQSVPKNAVLFVSGDTTTFGVWYSYYVLHNRSDIHLINPVGVGGNMFLDDAINQYKKENPKTPLNSLVSKTIASLMHKYRIFSTYELDTFPLPENTILVPLGLTYELLPKEKVPKENELLQNFESGWKRIHIVRRETLSLSEQNLVAGEIPMFYANGLNRIGDFILSYYNDPKSAEHYYRRALWIDNENASSYAGLSLSLYKGYNVCNDAISSMHDAIELYPIWENYYIQLYIMYNRCNIDTLNKDRLKKTYQAYFHKSLDKVTQPYLKEQKAK